jgi:fructose-1,6-bisphosphatase II
MVQGNQIFFAATGITDGLLLTGVRLHGREADTNSLVLRAETGTRRVIHTTHRLEWSPDEEEW